MSDEWDHGHMWTAKWAISLSSTAQEEAILQTNTDSVGFLFSRIRSRLTGDKRSDSRTPFSLEPGFIFAAILVRRGSIEA